MSNFNEWFKDYHSNNEAYAEQLTKDAFEAGAASRQAEMDCLKVELDAANERALMLLDHKNKMADKLQGEVDSINRDLNNAFATIEIQCEQIDALQKRIDELNGDQRITIDDLLKAKAECIRFTSKADELHDIINDK